MWQLPKLSPEEILIYLRKSRTDDPTLTVEETLAKHEQMLDDWIERNLPGQGRVPETNRLREVVSGETIDSRPRVQELLRLAESPRYKAILIVEPQRLSRGDLEDIGRLVKLLRYSNTLAITLQYTYDLRDERDRDLFERELKRGNEFLEYQKRIMNNGRLLSVQNGNFIGQKAPIGYRKTQVKEGKKKCYTLEPDPETAPIVKLIFEMYRDGYGMTRICDKLDAMGVPGPAGGRWSPDSIPRILNNEHYIGKVIWNKRPEVRTIRDGEVIVSRPRAENYLIFDGKHPAILPMDLWEAVQEKVGKIPRNTKARNFENPLAGLLYCRSCNKIMTRRTYRLADGTDRCAPRVACTDQRHCGTASSTLDDVLAEVVKTLREVIADFEIRIEQGTDDSVEIHRQMVDRLEKRLQELRELEIAQWDEKTKGGMPAHVFERLNGQTLREMEEVQQQLCTARDAIPEPVDLQEKVTSFRAALDALLDPDAPVREKNNLLKACIERIDYHRERVNGGHRRRGEQEAPMELDFTLMV
jgi:DNA invertase Pin-like site-specific DNA recombinase